MRFKEGDKVKVKIFKEIPGHWNPRMRDLMGEVVTIECIFRGGFTIKSKDEVWYLKESDVESIKNQCIVMYQKDNQVIALDKVTGKKAIAKCSTEDEFDFYTGCEIAFKRLTKKEETKANIEPLNAKICVLDDRDENFTKGKIYNIDNGKITDDKGHVWPRSWRFKNIDEVLDYFSAWENSTRTAITHYSDCGLKFIEVVE